MAKVNYKCPICDVVEEKTHAMNEDPKIICRSCGSEMYRMVSVLLRSGLEMNRGDRSGKI